MLVERLCLQYVTLPLTIWLQSKPIYRPITSLQS